VTFGGHTWRESPELADVQFAVLPVLRQLHECLWYLVEAEGLPAAAALREDVAAARARTEELAAASADELRAVDVGAYRRAIGELLQRVSERVRAGSRARDRQGANLMGADLRTRSLAGASLRGAYLIGADLRGVDLGRADLLGADLRAADVRGADLSRCLFLTQPQVTAARGDMSTCLPGAVARPAHWSE
jgi:hypothetical protein